MPSLDARRRAAIADFGSRLRTTLGPQLVDLRLFGSVARGDPDPESDIDLLIVVLADADRRRLRGEVIDLAFDVNLAHDVHISPRVVTEDILNDEIELRGSFLGAALREGIRL